MENFSNKVLSIVFRQAVPFTASLTADSDKEFALLCSSELLLPQDSEGTLIKVTYKPTLYGKTHKAKIIVQVKFVQSYCSNALLGE